MKRKGSAGTSRWTVDAYATDGGNKPVWAFVQGLEVNDKVEAIALVKLLEEQAIGCGGHSPVLLETACSSYEADRSGSSTHSFLGV